MAPFAKLLIANRGEIAVRIARTARGLGYRTVAVYSDADAGAPHTRLCDEAVRIGSAPAAHSYLDIAAQIDAALRTGAQAVHPGYGFLSENAEFATACAAAGLTFVGPPAAAIRAMGDKIAAKERMAAAGVPCLPSFSGTQTAAAFARAAAEIGYPVMLKAAAGGGGKGMRIVHMPDALPAALEATHREAERAFGSGLMLVERALSAARHVEVQIVADAHGGVIALGDRDCSLQRRHQKVIEEAPAPHLAPQVRSALASAAIAAARAVAYVGAGTIEFLLDASGAFYFLEMNTRLQVEHAVTEAVRGIDLVAWQLAVAAGDPLDALPGATATPAGHAIEARLYAEDPRRGYLPQAGRIVRWQPPAGEGIRVDHALADGALVTPYYDPMLAKIVASGRDREEARRRLLRALDETVLTGIATNRALLIASLSHPAFVAGDVHTAFLGDHVAGLMAPSEIRPVLGAVAAAAFMTRDRSGLGPGWRSRPGFVTPLRLRFDAAVIAFAVERDPDGVFAVTGGGETHAIALGSRDRDGRFRAVCDGIAQDGHATFDGDTLYLRLGADEAIVLDATFAPTAAARARTEGEAVAPMPGIVVRIAVAPGERVARGATLVVLEAMKMLHDVTAPIAGFVADVLVAPGQQVGVRAPLARVKATPQ